jgi:hypothetical protein
LPEELSSAQVRGRLVHALQLDLVGPSETLGDAKEALPQSPSRWYLTGFLVPLDAAPEDKSDETANDELDDAGEPGAAMTMTCRRNRRPARGIFHLLSAVAFSYPRQQRF